ncbi:hypothetical protein [Puia dinghuensis]|uniref:Uncharacterized protein n=1 Tax=Puia dinghuensis TaxID=1792502 RepID=A0A8J2XR32_9BACT|nr:hypothetical protein [Puia dinghuensis]GGA85292.1 hypothetical protein GCM10011511_05400 [Puia dinghuensis]
MRPSLLTLVTVLVIGLFSACSKIGKFNNPGADVHLCNIEKFFLTNYDHTTGLPGAPVEYNILYDAKGNPVEIKQAGTSTGYLSRFTFDKKGKMTVYRLDNFRSLTDSTIIFIHHYYNAPDGRLIVDTVYNLPSPGFPIIPPFDKLVLDEKERVIRDSGFYSRNPAILDDLVDYNYNANGNLASVIDEIFPTLNTTYPLYDDKVNYRQTNRAWQLIDKNYSWNNRLDPAGLYHITGYNAFGLPREIAYTPTPPDYNNVGVFLLYSPYIYNTLNFQYACDAPVSPGK